MEEAGLEELNEHAQGLSSEAAEPGSDEVGGVIVRGRRDRDCYVGR